MAWTWRFEAADGSEASPSVVPEEFTTQGDAESWVGEYWKDLLEGGTERVKLSDDAGTELYTMSLREAAEL